ncbi:threonyl-tRNA synthetase editing domain-containing protein [Acidilobus saccharovorans]|nr:threonyl-tRNA synthetase editing domain-containing protein [Acidilobus saccharovorans]
MRLLMIHVSEVKFWAVEEAIDNPPDPPSKFEGKDCVVGFISVEEGDTPDLAGQAAMEIAEHARRSGVKCAVVYPFAHLSPSLAPPDVAAEILRKVEDELKSMGFQTARAPFGWYKGFTITCPGHPACELSRTITAPKGPWYLPGDGSQLGIREAIERGLLPKEVEVGSPWDNESLGSQSKLGLTSGGLTSLGEVATGALSSWLAERLRLANVETRGGGPEQVYGIGGVAAVVKSCLDAGRYAESGVRVRSPLPGADMIVAPTDVGDEAMVKMLEELEEGISKDTTWIDVGTSKGFSIPYDIQYSLRLLAYRTRGGGLAALGLHGAVRDRQVTCFGPLRLIMSSLIDFGLKLADSGKTPYLPFWLSPLQVAVIPVKDQHVEYARRLLQDLIDVGARAYLDPPTKGLGARVRAAGKAWVPIIAVVGDKEVESNTVNIRRRWLQGQQEVVQAEALVEEVSQLLASGPGRSFQPPE